MSTTRSAALEAPTTSGELPVPLEGFRPSATVSAAVAWLERQSLFAVGLALVAVVTLATLPLHIHQDAYLALIGGRYVAQHGIPQHDSLALLTSGARWIDQQWLAQLLLYDLDRLGGMALFASAYVALTLSGVALAIAAARRLGGSERHVTWVLPLTAFLYLGASFEVRTQGFAYPLFIAVLWLLAAESKRATRGRVYLVFPLLILWANLHGSVVIGVALTALYGITLFVADLRRGLPLRVRLRTLAFLFGGPFCLVATPYGISGLSYYSETLNNPLFKTLVTEWRPVTSVAVLAVPFFLAAFATVWLFGFARGRVRLFETLALILLITAGISAVRNVTWFALAALVLLPPMLTATLPPPRRTPTRNSRLNLSLVAAGCIALFGTVVSTATRPASWFGRPYDVRALHAVVAQVARQPATRIYATSRFGDWLLWNEPRLAGRIAFDARFELLTQTQMSRLGHITEPVAPGEPDLLRGYGLLVVDPTDPGEAHALVQRAGARVILGGRKVEVAAVGSG